MSSPLTLNFKEGLVLAGMFAGNAGPSGSSYMIMGMGLLCVHCWCTCLVAQITLAGVESFDVGAEIELFLVLLLTLGGDALSSTLGGVYSVMMVCNALIGSG